jgi:hypothetical protein
MLGSKDPSNNEGPILVSQICGRANQYLSIGVCCDAIRSLSIIYRFFCRALRYPGGGGSEAPGAAAWGVIETCDGFLWDE